MDMPDPPAAAPAPEARPAPVPLRRIGPSERLTATLALSMIGFGVLILGVAFSQEDAAPVVPTLDVILTPTKTEEAPDNPDFIAQATNKGSGEDDFAKRPRDQQLSQIPKQEPGIAPAPLEAQAPPPVPEVRTRVLSTTGASSNRIPLPEDRPQTDPDQVLPTGNELMQRSAEIARMNADIAIRSDLYAKRPRRKNVTASTVEYEYAEYMRTWVEKVERVGNLNFPEEARRLGLSGSLIMTVSINRDGSVREVLINRSSGRKLLDDAAVRVVRLAAPYRRLPHTSEDFDVLDITRTWNFKNGSVDSDD
jgi:protein TonB